MNTEHTNQSSQAEPVNQQLLALAKSFGHKVGCAKNAFGEQCTCGADEAIAAAEQAQADDAEAEWRRLALQFDGHRMQALAHLRCLLENPEKHAEAVRAFLAAPPLSGEQVLAERIAEQAQQAESVAWVDCPVCGEHDMQRTTDGDGNSLIQCSNHACLSNGGTAQAVPPAQQQAEPVARDWQGIGDDQSERLIRCINAFDRIASGITETSCDKLIASKNQTKPRKMTIKDASEIAAIFGPILSKLHQELTDAAQPPAVAVPDDHAQRLEAEMQLSQQLAARVDELERQLKGAEVPEWLTWELLRDQLVAFADGALQNPATLSPDHLSESMERLSAKPRLYNALAGVRAMLAAAPQAAVTAPLPPYDTFSNDDGDSWQDCPDDAKFVNGRQLGEEFELLAGWHAERVTFRVTKVPDDESDDYEVEEVTAPAAAQKGGEA